MAGILAAPPADPLLPDDALPTRSPVESRETREITAEREYEFLGRHMLATYLGCEVRALCDHHRLLDALCESVEASGAHCLEMSYHAFPSSGLTALVLLSESHASIHTYPEHAACFVDLFTCGRSCSAERFDAVLVKYLKPAKVTRRVVIRNTDIQEDRFNEGNENTLSIG